MENKFFLFSKIKLTFTYEIMTLFSLRPSPPHKITGCIFFFQSSLFIILFSILETDKLTLSFKGKR